MYVLVFVSDYEEVPEIEPYTGQRILSNGREGDYYLVMQKDVDEIFKDVPMTREYWEEQYEKQYDEEDETEETKKWQDFSDSISTKLEKAAKRVYTYNFGHSPGTRGVY